MTDTPLTGEPETDAPMSDAPASDAPASDTPPVAAPDASSREVALAAEATLSEHNRPHLDRLQIARDAMAAILEGPDVAALIAIAADAAGQVVGAGYTSSAQTVLNRMKMAAAALRVVQRPAG